MDPDATERQVAYIEALDARLGYESQPSNPPGAVGDGPDRLTVVDGAGHR